MSPGSIVRGRNHKAARTATRSIVRFMIVARNSGGRQIGLGEWRIFEATCTWGVKPSRGNCLAIKIATSSTYPDGRHAIVEGRL